MGWIEAVAVVFGLACVWLTVRQNIWCWPTGLVQVALYIAIFYNAKLYSDMLLHGVYVVLQFYGWYYWLHGGKQKQARPVTMLPRLHRVLWPVVTIAATLAWGWLMATKTDASVPYGDAFTTAASLVAQWLMARKKWESWFFWIAVDVIAIGIYWYKDLYMTSGLYAVFLVLATVGLLAWRKSWREANEVAA